MWRAVAVIAPEYLPRPQTWSLGPWRDTLMTTPTPHMGPHEQLTHAPTHRYPYWPARMPACATELFSWPRVGGAPTPGKENRSRRRALALPLGTVPERERVCEAVLSSFHERQLCSWSDSFCVRG